MAERFVPFQSTLWAVIRGAGRGDRASFDRFASTYRRPLVCFIQGRGIPEADAEDLVQDVFIRIYEKGLLARLSEERGRFRSYLLGVARNVVAEQRRSGSVGKRGGGALKVGLDDVAVPAAAVEPDEEFDRLWVQNLLQVAFERLKEREAGEGVSGHDLLKSYTEGGLSYQDLADTHRMTETQVRGSLETARKRLRKLIQELLGEYVLSHEELEEERRFVARYLE